MDLLLENINEKVSVWHSTCHSVTVTVSGVSVIKHHISHYFHYASYYYWCNTVLAKINQTVPCIIMWLCFTSCTFLWVSAKGHSEAHVVLTGTADICLLLISASLYLLHYLSAKLLVTNLNPNSRNTLHSITLNYFNIYNREYYVMNIQYSIYIIWSSIWKAILPW